MAVPEPDFARFMQERGAVAQAYVCGDAAPLIAVSTDQELATVHRHADPLAESAKATGARHKTSELARRCLQAYVDKARDKAEALIAPDFRFTSPLDNGLDRETYFRRCWPNSSAMRAVQVIEAADCGNRALIVYECETSTKRFRNCEMHTSRGDQLVSVEVYFGWDLPHSAAPGQFVAPKSGVSAG